MAGQKVLLDASALDALGEALFHAGFDSDTTMPVLSLDYYVDFVKVSSAAEFLSRAGDFSGIEDLKAALYRLVPEDFEPYSEIVSKTLSKRDFRAWVRAGRMAAEPPWEPTKRLSDRADRKLAADLSRQLNDVDGLVLEVAGPSCGLVKLENGNHITTNILTHELYLEIYRNIVTGTTVIGEPSSVFGFLYRLNDIRETELNPQMMADAHDLPFRPESFGAIYGRCLPKTVESRLMQDPSFTQPIREGGLLVLERQGKRVPHPQGFRKIGESGRLVAFRKESALLPPSSPSKSGVGP